MMYKVFVFSLFELFLGVMSKVCNFKSNSMVPPSSGGL